VAPTFVVARNPDPDSTLPYLLRLPVDGGIELKAREPWPASARVYCHPLEEGWPEAAEVVEEVPVRSCARRGRAVDLVLDRARQNRSQFVFTEPPAQRRGGRPMIFWQTARTARRARPGQRVPTVKAAGGTALEITIDSRERYPYKFTSRPVTTQRSALPIGDYGVLDGDRLVAAVERKTFEYLVKSLIDGTARLPARGAGGAAGGRGGRRGALRRAGRRAACDARLAVRARGPAAGPLPERADRLRRLAQARRGLDAPLPRRRCGLSPRRVGALLAEPRAPPR
jgi:hypothetical protein